MIVTALILSFFDVAGFLFGLLPDVDLEVPLNVMNTFFDILSGVLYFFPMGYIRPIFSIIMSLQAWRVLVSVVRTVFLR